MGRNEKEDRAVARNLFSGKLMQIKSGLIFFSGENEIPDYQVLTGFGHDYFPGSNSAVPETAARILFGTGLLEFSCCERPVSR